MKVRESQIPEESSKAVKVEENSNSLITPIEEEAEDKKYIRSVVYFEDFGTFISLFYIITVDKDMRFVETPRARWQYGITINKGIEASPRIPVVNKSVWFEKEDYRDKRFKALMEKLEDLGFKVVNV